MEGVVTLVQEGRLQLTDDRGVSHLFILGYSGTGGDRPARTVAAASGAGPRALPRRAQNIIGNVLSSIELA